MNKIEFEAQARTEMGKKATNALRNEGLVPCVMYGGKDNVHFSATLNQLKDVVYTDKFVIAKVTVNGQTREAVLKDIDFHPITDKILHIDFQELVKGRKVKVEIPISTSGLARGVKNGGVLSQNLRKLTVKAKPEEFIPEIVVDITNLGIGKSIKVRELKDLSFEVVTPGSNPIVQVIVPRTLRSAGLKDDEEGEEDAEGAEGEATESTEAAE